MWIWDSRTHQFIVSKALEQCNPELVNLILIYQELFTLGIEAPNRIFQDFTNHFYHCTPNEYGRNSGGLLKKIDFEIQLIDSMLSNSNEIKHHQHIASFLKLILDTPLKSFIFELGVLSHYIADLYQPLHSDGDKRFKDWKTIHKILEADTRTHLDKFDIKIVKRKKIKSNFKFFEEQIYKINKNFDTIIENYYLDKGKVKPDRWDRTFPIVEYCLFKASQNISNVFMNFEKAVSIFRNHIQHAKLLYDIKGMLNSKTNYKVVKHPSGTISIRR